MSMAEWSVEANRLLDEWSEAEAQINELNRVAAAFQEKLSAAYDRCRDARCKFDTFMHGCMTVRAQAIEPQS